VLAALFAVASPSAAVPRHSTSQLPPVMLWAWEYPQDLRFADPARVGVAYLGTTVALVGADVRVFPRRQPLRVAPGTALVAVARIEIPRGSKAALSDSQLARTSRLVAALVRRPGVLGVQLDFDAPLSARPFYRRLLARVRAELPDSASLSMTALASWAMGDAWLEGLPVDAAVPMLFGMGADGARIRSEISRGADFAPALARGNVGVSLDEKRPPRTSGRRTWIFVHGPWTPARYDLALAGSGQASP